MTDTIYAWWLPYVTPYDLHMRLTFITLKKHEKFSEINVMSRYLLTTVRCYWKYESVFAGAKTLS